MEELSLLRQAVSTLNSVEVHGKDNMSKLLGCIYALEEIIQNSEQPTEEAGEPNAE